MPRDFSRTLAIISIGTGVDCDDVFDVACIELVPAEMYIHCESHRMNHKFQRVGLNEFPNGTCMALSDASSMNQVIHD